MPIDEIWISNTKKTLRRVGLSAERHLVHRRVDTFVLCQMMKKRYTVDDEVTFLRVEMYTRQSGHNSLNLSVVSLAPSRHTKPQRHLFI